MFCAMPVTLSRHRSRYGFPRLPADSEEAVNGLEEFGRRWLAAERRARACGDHLEVGHWHWYVSLQLAAQHGWGPPAGGRAGAGAPAPGTDGLALARQVEPLVDCELFDSDAIGLATALERALARDGLPAIDERLERELKPWTAGPAPAREIGEEECAGADASTLAGDLRPVLTSAEQAIVDIALWSLFLLQDPEERESLRELAAFCGRGGFAIRG